MVPKAEKKIPGLGERDCTLFGHAEESDSMTAIRFDEVAGRLFRAIAWTVGRDESDSKLVRMCDP